MSKVYLALPGTLDRLLGHVHDDGRVIRSQPGFDAEIGHVDLKTGRIYEARFGPDQEIGTVDLSGGKVYRSRLGPNEYVGQVEDSGRMVRHVAMGLDQYVGNVEAFTSYAHSAAAMLLLVLPALDETQDGLAGQG
jgi:hypothetical protein